MTDKRGSEEPYFNALVLANVSFDDKKGSEEVLLMSL